MRTLHWKLTRRDHDVIKTHTLFTFSATENSVLEAEVRTLQRKLARRDNDVIKMERELHKLRVRASTCIYFSSICTLYSQFGTVWHIFVLDSASSAATQILLCGRVHWIEPWTVAPWLLEFLTNGLNAKSKLHIITH